MNAFKLLSASLLAAAALLAGCSGDCSSASDCKFMEVCYKGTCTPGQQPLFSTQCTMDNDCTDPLVCRSGVCAFDETTLGNVTQGPTGDMGQPDMMMGPMDMTMGDTGTPTTADAGPMD